MLQYTRPTHIYRCDVRVQTEADGGKILGVAGADTDPPVAVFSGFRGKHGDRSWVSLVALVASGMTLVLLTFPSGQQPTPRLVFFWAGLAAFRVRGLHVSPREKLARRTLFPLFLVRLLPPPTCHQPDLS